MMKSLSVFTYFPRNHKSNKSIHSQKQHTGRMTANQSESNYKNIRNNKTVKKGPAQVCLNY